MKKLFAICLVALTALISVHLQAQEVETLVLIDTDMGKIKVKLFNDTPRHRDNFIKNVNEHLYDGSSSWYKQATSTQKTPRWNNI